MPKWKLHRIEVQDNAWQKLIFNHPHLLFHEPLWTQVTKAGLAGETCCLIWEKEGKVFGGMLGFVKRLLWAKFLYFSLPYGGMIGELPEDSSFSQILSDFAHRENITRIRILEGPMLQPTPSEGFHLVENYTHILNLKGMTVEIFWKGLKSRIRRDVRKARKSGVVVKLAENHSGANAFYRLYLDSMRRNKAVPKYGISFVKAVLEHVVEKKKGALLLADMQSETVAGILVVDSDIMTHYLMAGSLTERLKYCPNDLLIYEAIKRSINNGMDYFDFLPSGSGDISLIRFKQKWGADSHRVNTLDLVLQPMLMKFWDITYQVAQTKIARQVIQWRQKRI